MDRLPPNDTPKSGGRPILGAADRMLACVCVLSSRGGVPYTPQEINAIALLVLIEMGMGSWCQESLWKVYDLSYSKAGWYVMNIVTILTPRKVGTDRGCFQ